MARQDDLRLIITPPQCWSKCAIKILSNSKGMWGRQRQTGYAKYLPAQARLTSWGICWVSVLLRERILSQPQKSHSCGLEMNLPRDHPLLWVAVSFWREGLSSVISASHTFTMEAHGMGTSLDQMCLVEILWKEVSILLYTEPEPGLDILSWGGLMKCM